MAKVISPTSGALFLGTLSAQSRSYLLRLFRAARQRGYQRFVEPACGAFAMSHLAVQAGFLPAQIEASDVSFFSTAMGYAIMGKPLDDLNLTIRLGNVLDGLDAQEPAVALWAVNYIRLLRNARNPVAEAARKEALAARDQQVEQLRSQLARARATLGGMTYCAEDLTTHLARVWDDPTALVCVNPPTYTGGFEKYYDMGGLLLWQEPVYGVFDAETGLENLMQQATAARALVICYQEREGGEALGHPIYMEDGIRRAKGLAQQTHMFLCANRGDEALQLTGGFGLNRRTIADIWPGDFTVLPAGYEPHEKARLEIMEIPNQVALYYRSVWTHKFAVDGGGNTGKGVAILLDGYLVGVFGYDLSFVVGWKAGTDTIGRLMLHYGMAVPNRGYRYNRLLTMVAMCRETINRCIADAFYASRVCAVGTVQQTPHPESKEMRGLMKLDKRKPDPRYGYKLVYVSDVDEQPLATVLPRWLQRERSWLKARQKAKKAEEHG